MESNGKSRGVKHPQHFKTNLSERWQSLNLLLMRTCWLCLLFFSHETNFKASCTRKCYCVRETFSYIHISLWWHNISFIISIQTCYKHIFRNGLADIITRVALFCFLSNLQVYSETKDNAALGLEHRLFWITLLRCLMTCFGPACYSLIFYVREWDESSLCSCVLSQVVWKVFVLHVCMWFCGDCLVTFFVSIIWWKSTTHKSCALQRHSSSGLTLKILAFTICSGMSVIIKWTLWF